MPTAASAGFGPCGVVSGCTGDRQLAVITDEQLSELGSLQDVDLFVRLSGLRVGSLWCAECHRLLYDATSASRKAAGRKRHLGEISGGPEEVEQTSLLHHTRQYDQQRQQGQSENHHQEQIQQHEAHNGIVGVSRDHSQGLASTEEPQPQRAALCQEQVSLNHHDDRFSSGLPPRTTATSELTARELAGVRGVGAEASPAFKAAAEAAEAAAAAAAAAAASAASSAQQHATHVADPSFGAQPASYLSPGALQQASHGLDEGQTSTAPTEGAAAAAAANGNPRVDGGEDKLDGFMAVSATALPIASDMLYMPSPPPSTVAAPDIPTKTSVGTSTLAAAPPSAPAASSLSHDSAAGPWNEPASAPASIHSQQSLQDSLRNAVHQLGQPPAFSVPGRVVTAEAPLPQNQPPPQLQAALQHHSAAPLEPIQGALHRQQAPSQESQSLVNQQQYQHQHDPEAQAYDENHSHSTLNVAMSAQAQHQEQYQQHHGCLHNGGMNFITAAQSGGTYDGGAPAPPHDGQQISSTSAATLPLPPPAGPPGEGVQAEVSAPATRGQGQQTFLASGAVHNDVSGGAGSGARGQRIRLVGMSRQDGQAPTAAGVSPLAGILGGATGAMNGHMMVGADGPGGVGTVSHGLVGVDMEGRVVQHAPGMAIHMGGEVLHGLAGGDLHHGGEAIATLNASELSRRSRDPVTQARKSCCFPGCTAQLPVVMEGEKRRITCANHRIEDMMYVKPTRNTKIAKTRCCDFEGCTTYPSYNVKGKRRARRCGRHRLDGMVDVKAPCCEHPGCPTLPYYGTEGEKRRRRCAVHRLPGMVDVKSRRCEFEGCLTQPTYGLDGDLKAKRCAKHKDKGMINIVHRHCEHPGCTVQPYYGVEGNRGGSHCAAHKLPGMVKTKGQRCNHPGCSTRPSYGHDGDKKPSLCGKHKTAGMVDVINRRCEHPGCVTQPTHAVEGSNLATRCAVHQIHGMVNIKSRRCGYDGCTTQPYYGFPGDKRGSRCSKHKDSRMIDVHNRRCVSNNCQISASFGRKDDGKGATHCAKHKLHGMSPLYRRKVGARAREEQQVMTAQELQLHLQRQRLLQEEEQQRQQQQPQQEHQNEQFQQHQGVTPPQQHQLQQHQQSHQDQTHDQLQHHQQQQQQHHHLQQQHGELHHR